MSSVFRSIFRFFAEYFVVLVGLLFIFVIGVLYALISPEGVLVNSIFLLIFVGWIIFEIKYFWDIIDRTKKNSGDYDSSTNESYQTHQEKKKLNRL
jgi:ABC-type bacteriocin/lantibiotic exporter with double-glycine peptidase domain